MKRVIIGILCIVCMVCTGCSRKYTQDVDVQPTSNVQYTYISDAQNYYSECNVADDGVGYYFTDQKVYGNEIGYELYYYDRTQDRAVPLCSKINCKHDDKSCEAYFTNDKCMNGFIWYQNNSLFRIERDIDTGNMYLVSFNRDGSNPTRGNILWNGDNIRYTKLKTIYYRSMVMHKGYLYYTFQLDVNDDVSLYRVKIDSNQERELLGTISNTDDIKSFGEIHISNNSDNIYFSTLCSLNDENMQEMILTQYNMDSGICDTLLSEKGSTDYKYIKDDSGKTVNVTGNGWSGKYDIMDLAFDNKNNMYLYKGVTGEVFQYNLQTKDMKKIYQTEGSGNIVYYDDALYLNNYNRNYDGSVMITEIDTDGKLIEQIDPETPYNYFGDSNLMISKKQVRTGSALADVYYIYDKSIGEWKEILENNVMK